jgi:hypothetical protein
MYYTQFKKTIDNYLLVANIEKFINPYVQLKFMGKIIEATFDRILPGEDGLDEKALAGVISFAESNKLLPIPVRELNGMYLHLDGRHSLIYNHLAGSKSVQLFLLNNHLDGMHNPNFPNIETYLLRNRNENIRQRWISAENIFRRLNVRNYDEHFENLKQKYDFLTDLDTCKQYLRNKGLF